MAAAVATGLSVRDLKVSYGRVAAVRGISFDVPEGTSVGIIGANGAGKSSTLKAIFRLVDSTAESMSFGDVSLASPTKFHKFSRRQRRFLAGSSRVDW